MSKPTPLFPGFVFEEIIPLVSEEQQTTPELREGLIYELSVKAKRINPDFNNLSLEDKARILEDIAVTEGSDVTLQEIEHALLAPVLIESQLMGDTEQ